LAAAAIEQLQLDELRVVPTGFAGHKSRPLSPSEHRMAMALLAFSGLPGVIVDDRELRREGSSYTIDTLEALMAEQAGSVLFLVIGGDQLAAFNQWRRWQDILALATVCVAQRLPQRGKSAHPVDRPSALPDYLPLQFPAMPVSATDIRLRLAAQGREFGSVPADLQGLIPQDVATYIFQHMLYQSNPIIP
jgi:nicotinate-nucleotide adenylyltransferase